jgi:hypothetical protein
MSEHSLQKVPFLPLGFGILFVPYEVLVRESALQLMDQLDLGFTLALSVSCP